MKQKLYFFLGGFIIGVIIAFLFMVHHENVEGSQVALMLPPGQKLSNAYCKDQKVWCLTRSRHQGESAESWLLQEQNMSGSPKTTIVFKEQD